MKTYAQASDSGFFGTSPSGEEDRDTLTEVCSPVFLFLTTFRRNSATSDMTVDELRARVKQSLETARRRLEDAPGLRRFLDRAWYVLVATADQAVLSSSWKGATEWRMRLLESEYFQTATGGQRFYEILEQVLGQAGDEAALFSELMFTCMALGFQGELLGDSRNFERKRMALYDKARLAGAMGDHLTPDAYGRNDKRTLTMLPKVGLLRVTLISLTILVVFLVIHEGLVEVQASKISKDVEKLIEQERPAEPSR